MIPAHPPEAATVESSTPFSAVPPELRQRTQWMAWWSVIGEGKRVMLPNGELTSRPLAVREKPHKLPINPRTGGLGASNRPRTWAELDVAVDAAERFGITGVGYVFDGRDGFGGIDLDNCRDPLTGVIAPEAMALIRLMDSYAEVSPSGTGVKIFFKGRLRRSCASD